MPTSTNGIETYSKKTLNDKIRRLIITNAQLIADKIETEKIKVNLETDKIRLFNEKNSLIVKKKEFRAEIVVLNITGFFNVLICKYQNLFLKLIQDKFKVKRLLSFNSLKENFQRFFIKIRYYQGFY